MDDAKNSAVQGTEGEISTDGSKVKVVVVPTDEELMIALDTEQIVLKMNP
jgi:acetate kinase